LGPPDTADVPDEGDNPDEEDFSGEPTPPDLDTRVRPAGDDVGGEEPGAEEDSDKDGIPVDEDCDDEDPDLGSQSLDQDCDGVLTGDDCDDSDPDLLSTQEDPDCDGVAGTDTGQEPCVPCGEEDMDCDGACWYEDCDDMNPFTTVMADDADCDGFLTHEDCDDTDASVRPGGDDIGLDGIDQNCDGVDAIFLTPAQELAVDWVRSLLALDCDGVQDLGTTLTDLAAPVPGDPCPQVATSSQTSTTGPLTQGSSSALYSGGCTDSLGVVVTGGLGVDETSSYEDLLAPAQNAYESLNTWDLESLGLTRQASSPSSALALEATAGTMHTTTSHTEGPWFATTTDSCQWTTTVTTTLQAGASGPWVDGTTTLDLAGSSTIVEDFDFLVTTHARSVSGTASTETSVSNWTAQITGASWWRLFAQDPGRFVEEGGMNQPSSGQVTVEMTDPISGSLLHTLELTFGGCVDAILYYESWPLGPPNTFTPGPYGPPGCSGCAEATIDGQPAVRQCGGWNF